VYHTRVLISLAKRSQKQLKDCVDAFIRLGGSIFWQNSTSGSVLSLIMRHGASFECIRECLFLQPAPWTVDELFPLDRWLIGMLAYTDTSFRKALQTYLDSFRSLFKNQGVRRKTISAFDIDIIVYEVQNASAKDRIQFLKIVSKWGTSEMIAPFVRAGFDLDEKSSNEQTPWLRLSYLGKAVKWGNLDTFHALLDAGACPTKALIHLSRYPDSLPPCEHPESRKDMILSLAERAHPQQIAGSDESSFSLLLRTDEVRRYSSTAADGLIERFILSRDNIIGQETPELLNSYILIALFLDLPYVLQYFHDRGFHIDGNTKVGRVLGGPGLAAIKSDVVGKYTWLTCAVHFGRASCVKFFLESGADIARLDPSSWTPLQMARDYAAGPHPRAATKIYIWPYQPPQRVVSAEDDGAALDVFQLGPVSPSVHKIRKTSGSEAPARNCRTLRRIYSKSPLTDPYLFDSCLRHRSCSGCFSVS
jgi:ankyrin repeat protein